MRRMALLFYNLKQDSILLGYFFLLVLAMRLGFLLCFSQELNNLNSGLVWQSLWLGTRLSCNTVIAIAFISLLFITIPSVSLLRYNSNKYRCIWGTLASLVLIYLFLAAIPYYKAFHGPFDLNILNIFYDDAKATLITCIRDFHLIELWLLFLAIIGCFVWGGSQRGLLLNRLLQEDFREEQYTFSKLCTSYVAIILAVIIYALYLLMHFGGSLKESHAITIDNCARFNNGLLNTAVMDPLQASKSFLKVYKDSRNLLKKGVTSEELAKALARLGLKRKESLAASLRKIKTRPALLSKKPQNIIVFIGESFGNFPNMPEYLNLDLTPNCQRVISSGHAVAVDNFMSDGHNTFAAVSSLLTGLPMNGLHCNYFPKTYKEQYVTGLARQMKKLGYRTVFWYGGYSEWQRIEAFTKAQGFDEFYGIEDFQCTETNIWGCSDMDLVQNFLLKEQGRLLKDKTLHVILTTSNHAPYNIDMTKEGYPFAKVAAQLPDSIKDDENARHGLSYLWYTDKCLGWLMQEVTKVDKDCLWFITGDHSERFNFAVEVPQKVRSSVPGIIYQRELEVEQFKGKAYAGSQLQLAATLMDLIAPQGQEYYALRESLLIPNNSCHNFKLYGSGEKWLEFRPNDKEDNLRETARAEELVAAYSVLKEN